MARFLAFPRFALVAAAALTLPVAAQQPDKPLGDLLQALPMPETAPVVAPPADAPPPLPPAPVVAPGTVGTTELPPSAVADAPLADDLDAGAAEAEAGLDPPPATAAADLDDGGDQAQADADWAALQELRRQKVNEVESPLVADLNREMLARQEEERRLREEAAADHARSVAEHEADVRRREAEHRAEMDAFRRRVEREQADYRARVEACLAGDRRFCRKPGE